MIIIYIPCISIGEESFPMVMHFWHFVSFLGVSVLSSLPCFLPKEREQLPGSHRILVPRGFSLGLVTGEGKGWTQALISLALSSVVHQLPPFSLGPACLSSSGTYRPTRQHHTLQFPYDVISVNSSIVR